jgi:ThiF family
MNQQHRHELDAGGLLVEPDDRREISVLVRIDGATAHLPSVQHAAWMTINELVRLRGVVSAVGLSCPPGVALAGRIVPLAPRQLDLASAILAGGEEIGIVPVTIVAADEDDAAYDRTLLIGPGESNDGIRVHGEGWWGGYSDTSVVAAHPEDPNPIGPYIAASLIVGELFCALALRDYEATPQLFLSAWTLTVATEPPDACPPLEAVELDVLLVGVGAVGSMVVHVLWAADAVTGKVVLCDADPKGVDDTNLNRYVFFGRSSIGKQKASEAAGIGSDARVHLDPIDGPVQTVENFPARVVSAVDINTAREAIQARYPARILSASTRDLRAELLRVAAPHAGGCLRCFNPPEEQPDDNALRQAIETGEYGDVADLAAAHGLTVEEIEAWVVRGECGRASERLLPALRSELRLPPEFAISFVSSLAGVLLAAELLKDTFAVTIPLDDTKVRFVFQFAKPLARTNRPGCYLPDPSCPLCGSGANQIGVAKWKERARTLVPVRASQST